MTCAKPMPTMTSKVEEEFEFHEEHIAELITRWLVDNGHGTEWMIDINCDYTHVVASARRTRRTS